jgi:maltose O-acetyltransferase
MYALRAKLWRCAGIDIDRTARLTASVRIMGRFPLRIGADTFVGHETLIVGGDAPINIGAHCDIGPRVTIVNGTHETGQKSNLPRAAGEGISRPISIDDGAWIGAGSTILGGVRIGKRAIVGAGSVVTSDVAADTMAAGIPCRPIRQWNGVNQKWQILRDHAAATATS